MPGSKKDIVAQLQKELLTWQGYKPPQAGLSDAIGLGEVEHAFPGAVFPKGVIHEFVCTEHEHAAATGGFIGGLLNTLLVNNGVCLWVGTSRLLFPPSLKLFGVEPDRIIFIDVVKEKDVLWVTEEALKCEGLSVVIAELRSIDIIQFRRLQLAVELSKVTGFLLRTDAGKLSANASAARWRITSKPSEPLEDGMPGVGLPRWQVDLLKVRNGNPGSWTVEWYGNKFNLPQNDSELATHELSRKAG